MMRSLWTAASGMTAQQLNVDTISNNITNVNTTSFKKERTEFKSLMYQTLERASLDAGDTGAPVNLQVGLGVKPVAITKMFTMGSLQSTGNSTDVAIEGNGMFVVQTGDNEVSYTRDGSFKVSTNNDENFLVTSEGYFVLDIDGNPVTFPGNVSVDSLNISPEAGFSYTQDGDVVDLDVTLAIVQFSNPQGLENLGGNLYSQTVASGEPIFEIDGNVPLSNIVQGYLEMSNVNIAEEMINLIVAQRAYELNSKAITTSDDMLQQAAGLKR